MMFCKLSLKNIKNSFRNYTIYFITLIVGVAIFYTFNSMDSQSAMLQLSSSKKTIIQSMIDLFSIISVVVSIILGYLIVYANNFLIRRRKKEFGLYQTLGMSKTKIARILLIETVIVGIMSLIVGLFMGVFLAQGMSVLIIQMFQADMSAYKFNFSMAAIIKTCIYFGGIYVLVMIFNVVTVSRYKLINLLSAAKKNESLKLKGTTASVVMFLASLLCIGTAYYMLRNQHVLLESVNKSIIMIVLGTIGTYLLFSSLAGFLLKLVQTRKNIYYRNLNMFVLRQVNSRVNTMKVSMTIISILLLLTIGVMSSALSLVSAFNSDIQENNCSDVTLIGVREQDVDILDSMKKQGYDYTKQLGKAFEFTVYYAKDEKETMENYVGEKNLKKLEDKYQGLAVFNDNPFKVIKLSDYNKIMEMYGDKKLGLKENEYALVANFKQLVPMYEDLLKENRELTIGGKSFVPNSRETIKVPLENSNLNSETGIFIIPDKAFEKDAYEIQEHRVLANYVKGDKEEVDEQFQKNVKPFKDKDDALIQVSFTRVEMEMSQIGTATIFTFLGLYLGIIFSITSAAILAIGQLSESSDNKERYAILRKIGVDDKMINHSLRLQIGIYFILPLLVAIVHSFVGIQEVARIISILGNMQLNKNILLTALFLVIVYGGYFIATYIGSKGIIKEREKYVG